MIYHCCDERRRNAVAAHPTLNGIDYLEVLDHDAPAGSPRQRTLLVRLLKRVPAGFAAQQVRIEGGERVRDIEVEWVASATAPPPETTPAEQAFFAALPAPDHVLLVRVDRYGDFSTHLLRLVRSAIDATPPQGFDPRLSEVGFSFKVDCPSEFDCRDVLTCPEEPGTAPVIDYLAKDYPSFRRLILDRITQLVPDWQERSAADLGVTLAELIAYVGDQLSYQQDAIATEAYLDTARLRTSLRRHTLLVDYHMHDGCNARVWLHVPANAGGVALPRAGTRFYSRLTGRLPRIAPGSRDDEEALRANPAVFEPLHDAVLQQQHNEIPFYTWGDERCCLPKGATNATLARHLPALRIGDVLLFEEVKGPLTGEPGDADPAHRHVLRLTSVRQFSPDDPAAPLTDPLTGTEITEIAWAAADALSFPLCISSQTDQEHGEVLLENVSVARGNVVLADHGRSLPGVEALGTVPPARLAYPPKPDVDRCSGAAPIVIPPRFTPHLANAPLTFAGTVLKTSTAAGTTTTSRVAFDLDAPAASAMQWRMEDTLPAIALHSVLEGVPQDWESRRDLLNSEPDAPHFVVEVEHDGSTALRFGDDAHGRRPEPGTVFTARYRIGNGWAGNVGAGAIAHVVSGDADVLGVRNPLPAQGGVDMEDDTTVRRRAPRAFRRQERAVTPEDYAEVTERHTAVQRAAATLRWTGSWYTAFITVDRVGGLPMDAAFANELTGHVERYRMAGEDTEFNGPVYVSLEIDLLVCVQASYLRGDVRAGLLEVLSNRVLPDGRRGLFHPDNFSFGQTVYLSPLYAAARQVAGVASVQATRFQRQGTDDPTFLANGYMTLSRLEIARLDNDPNFPEHGVLRLSLFGGK
jgi:baseplate J-like protein